MVRTEHWGGPDVVLRVFKATPQLLSSALVSQFILGCAIATQQSSSTLGDELEFDEGRKGSWISESPGLALHGSAQHLSGMQLHRYL